MQNFTPVGGTVAVIPVPGQKKKQKANLISDKMHWRLPGNNNNWNVNLMHCIASECSHCNSFERLTIAYYHKNVMIISQTIPQLLR